MEIRFHKLICPPLPASACTALSARAEDDWLQRWLSPNVLPSVAAAAPAAMAAVAVATEAKLRLPNSDQLNDCTPPHQAQCCPLPAM